MDKDIEFGSKYCEQFNEGPCTDFCVAIPAQDGHAAGYRQAIEDALECFTKPTPNGWVFVPLEDAQAAIRKLKE